MPVLSNVHPATKEEIYHQFFFVSGYSIIVTSVQPHPVENLLYAKTYQGPTFKAEAEKVAKSVKEHKEAAIAAQAAQKAALEAAAKQGRDIDRGEGWRGES